MTEWRTEKNLYDNPLPAVTLISDAKGEIGPRRIKEVVRRVLGIHGDDTLDDVKEWSIQFPYVKGKDHRGDVLWFARTTIKNNCEDFLYEGFGRTFILKAVVRIVPEYDRNDHNLYIVWRELTVMEKMKEAIDAGRRKA
jgi:hypothetical protein